MRSPTQPTEQTTPDATGDIEPARADEETPMDAFTRHPVELKRIIDELDGAIASWE